MGDVIRPKEAAWDREYKQACEALDGLPRRDILAVLVRDTEMPEGVTALGDAGTDRGATVHLLVRSPDGSLPYVHRFFGWPSRHGATNVAYGLAGKMGVHVIDETMSAPDPWFAA